MLIRSRYPRVLRGVVEVCLVLTLWVGYSFSRLIADTSMTPALNRAQELLNLEAVLRIHWELPLNELFTSHQVLGLLGSYWYASLHYVVTGAVLLWLYRLGSHTYVPARRALVLATLLGLVAYLLMPTAPPRFIQGYVDVLSLHAADGWWSTDASAPRGLGGLTNELAAFPSLHAGWALWVALSIQRHSGRTWLRALAWVYAAGTGVVIVGTGNHWVLDVLVGWLVVLVGWVLASRIRPAPLAWWGHRHRVPETGTHPPGGAPVAQTGHVQPEPAAVE